MGGEGERERERERGGERERERERDDMINTSRIQMHMRSVSTELCCGYACDHKKA